MASPFFFQASSCNLIVGGNLGVGTNTPISKLAVNGGLTVGTYSGTAAPANSLIVSGNVGIGTTTPQTALSVNGTVSATALVGDGNGLTNTLSGSISSASASGTDIDFNNIIPSWAKRITVIFNGVSTNGTTFKYIQVGYGSTPTYYSTGYQTGSARFSGSASSASVATVGFLINSGSTGDILNGSLIITKLTDNYWSCMGNVTYYSSGTITMAGGINMTTNVLTSIRITTGNGTDQYDAGIITVMYE